MLLQAFVTYQTTYLVGTYFVLILNFLLCIKARLHRNCWQFQCFQLFATLQKIDNFSTKIDRKLSTNDDESRKRFEKYFNCQQAVSTVKCVKLTLRRQPQYLLFYTKRNGSISVE